MNNRGAPELPEDIIKHILSFLPTDEAVGTSLLSKTWLKASSQLPNLHFSHSHFPSLEKFTQFVNTTLARQSNHNLSIHSFALSAPILDTESVSSIDKWLGIAVEKGVKHLSISLTSEEKSMITYTLPETIFTSDSLISLDFRDPVVENKSPSIRLSLSDQVPRQLKKCHTLKRLHLKRVHVKKSTMGCLGSVFPSIEELSIDDCFELDTISLFRFRNLKRLYIRSFLVPVYMILVEQLESFTFKGLDCFPRGAHYIRTVFPFPNLKHLRLENTSIPDEYFDLLMSHCPSLEDLVLVYCVSLKKISVSSHTLKRMELHYVHKLEEVNIDAPNLVALDYVCGTFPAFSFTSVVSTNFMPCVHVNTDIGIDVDTTFMIKLRGLLTELNLSRVSLTLKCLENSFCFEELRMVPIVYSRPRLKNLELEIVAHPSVRYSVLLDGLFWSFFPETLTVFYTSDEHLKLVKVLCKELMDRRRPNCCSSNYTMCWRHYLNHAEVEYLEDSEDQPIVWRPLDWKSLLDGSISLRYNSEIRYSLIW